jgi:hypothetical protein
MLHRSGICLRESKPQRSEKLKGNNEFFEELVIQINFLIMINDVRRSIKGEILSRSWLHIDCLLEDLAPVVSLIVAS